MNKRTALFASLLLIGCAPMSPLVKLNPTAPVSTPTFKNHPAIYLTVQDSRSGEALGLLPARPNEKQKAATAAVPVEEVVRQHVIAALTKSGFECLATPTATSPQLVVQIKRLDFKIIRGATWSEISGAGNLSVSAQAGTKTRTKNYAAENGQKWAFTPPPDGHEKYLNLLLTDMLNAFLTDQDFLSFLAKETF